MKVSKYKKWGSTEINFLKNNKNLSVAEQSNFLKRSRGSVAHKRYRKGYTAYKKIIITNDKIKKEENNFKNLLKNKKFVIGCGLFDADGTKDLNYYVKFTNSSISNLKDIIQWFKIIGCKKKDLKGHAIYGINKAKDIQKIKNKLNIKFYKDTINSSKEFRNAKSISILYYNPIKSRAFKRILENIRETNNIQIAKLYLKGWIIGDGSSTIRINKRGFLTASLRIFCQNTEQCDWIINCMKLLKVPFILYTKNSCTTISCPTIYVCRKPAILWLFKENVLDEKFKAKFNKFENLVFFIPIQYKIMPHKLKTAFNMYKNGFSLRDVGKKYKISSGCLRKRFIHTFHDNYLSIAGKRQW
jgi:hypothetical protein